MIDNRLLGTVTFTSPEFLNANLAILRTVLINTQGYKLKNKLFSYEHGNGGGNSYVGIVREVSFPEYMKTFAGITVNEVDRRILLSAAAEEKAY